MEDAVTLPDGTKAYLIQGIPHDPSHPPPPRRNILDMASADPSDPDKTLRWNLFLQALAMLQGYDDTDNTKNDTDDDTESTLQSLMYYQVSGIHGAPYIHWMEPPQKGDRPGDYCTHGTVLFLTWHRVYMLLLEQLLVKKALEYVSRIEHTETRERYKRAALQIRIPYWDWATDPNLPQPTRDSKCMITLPQRDDPDPKPVSRLAHNPLYSYRYKSTLRRTRDFNLVSTRTSPNDIWVRWTDTKRCPGDQGDSQPRVVDAQMNGSASSGSPNRRPFNWRAGIYNLLTNVRGYYAFTNQYRRSAPPVEFFALEQYHNSVHAFTGTNLGRGPEDRQGLVGHMGSVGMAAFDPIFWLHHANVDRIYAMWQAIRYEAIFEPGVRTEQTRLPAPPTGPGGVEAYDVKTPLRPFVHRIDEQNKRVYWDSSMIQNAHGTNPISIFDLGHTYTDIPYERDEKKLAQLVRQRVDELYSPRRSTFVSDAEVPDLAKKIKSLKPAEYSKVNIRREWTIIFEVKRYLIPGNFTIFFFLGRSIAEAPHTWIGSHNLVGTFDTFKSETEICTNCATMEQENRLVQGAIDITDSLYNALVNEQTRGDDNRARLVTLNDIAEVERYLRASLTWRVISHDTGEAVDIKRAITQDNLALRVRVASFLLPCPKPETKYEEDFDYDHCLLDDVCTHDNTITNESGLKEIGGW